MAKILILDIETAPNVAYVWGAWRQNVGQNQWVRKGYIMSYAAKWLDEDNILYEANRTANDKKLVKSLYELLDKADIVVAHNAKKFDIPVILGRGAIHGINPPSPFHIVDTYVVARNEFRVVSNTLSNLAEEFGLEKKFEHKAFPGFDLWVECLNQNDLAWEELKTYNIQDVITLEQLYLRMRPYMKYHPNVVHNVEEKGDVCCAKCGSDNIHFRGYYNSRMGLAYHRFVCNDCGGWGRSRYANKDERVNNGRNAI